MRWTVPTRWSSSTSVAAPAATAVAGRRVVIGRGSASPLLVDPETRTATFAAEIRSEALMLCWNNAVYFHARLPRGSGVCRIGFPDFASEVVSSTRAPPVRGAFFEGVFHKIAPHCEGYYVTRDLKEPWRSVDCDIPGHLLGAEALRDQQLWPGAIDRVGSLHGRTEETMTPGRQVMAMELGSSYSCNAADLRRGGRGLEWVAAAVTEWRLAIRT